MKRGGKRIIVLPPNLANTRQGSLIPYETPQRVPVVFLVSLLLFVAHPLRLTWRK